MSKISFSKVAQPVETPVPGVVIDCESTVCPDPAPVTEAVPPVKLVDPIAALPVATRPEAPALFDEENIGFDDVILPRINICQKVGPLSNVYTPGEIILNQQLPLFTPSVVKDGQLLKAGTDPLTIIVLGFQKRRFVEKVAGGGMGAMFDNEEAVVKAGGTLDYREHEEKIKMKIASKLFQRMATALVLVQKPSTLVDEGALLFPYEQGDQHFTVALWSMKGTAYTNGAKPIFTARKMGHLRAGGYPSYTYLLSTKLETYSFSGQENFAHIPVLKAGVKNTPEFVAFARDIIGCGA